MYLILILLPLLFQIIYGRKAIGEDIKLSFGTICLISFFSQIAVTVIDFFIIANVLQRNNNACGMPLVGLIKISLFFTFLLIVTIIVQYFIKKSYERE